MTPFVGQIIAVGFNFAPPGWFLCNGQLVPIAEYEVLYNLIGTTYGGNGQTNFGIPDLRGRTPISMGGSILQGQVGGSENVTLNATQIGSHSHPLLASTQASTTNTPSSTLVLGQATATELTPYAPPGTLVALSTASITAAGSNQPHENRQPFTVLNYIIAWSGIYPSQ